MRAWINFFRDRPSHSRRCLSSLFLAPAEPGGGSRVLKQGLQLNCLKTTLLVKLWLLSYLDLTLGR